MCGRLACSLFPQEACKAVAYPSTNERKMIKPSFVDFGNVHYSPSYNISPSQAVLVLTDSFHLQTDTQVSKYVVTPMHWGLLADWTKANSAYKTHNTKLETIIDLPLPKTEMKRNRRGVLVCDGYYEWQTVYKRSGQPYYFYNTIQDTSVISDDLMDKPIMKLAVIFNKHTNENDEVNISCSVVTKEADKDISFIHHRMPVVLNSFDAVESWINSKIPFEESYEFLRNHNSKRATANDSSNVILQYHQVDRQYVNTSTNNSEKCIERISGKRQLSMKDWLTCGPAWKK